MKRPTQPPKELSLGLVPPREPSSPSTNPTTPVNRTFGIDSNPSFATAVVSPGSDEIQAARARARSRSEAKLYKVEVPAGKGEVSEHGRAQVVEGLGDLVGDSSEDAGQPGVLPSDASAHDSPSLMRRSRILSANIAVATVTCHLESTNDKVASTARRENTALLRVSPLKADERKLSIFTGGRPRASTLSAPSTKALRHSAHAQHLERTASFLHHHDPQLQHPQQQVQRSSEAQISDHHQRSIREIGRKLSIQVNAAPTVTSTRPASAVDSMGKLMLNSEVNMPDDGPQDSSKGPRREQRERYETSQSSNRSIRDDDGDITASFETTINTLFDFTHVTGHETFDTSVASFAASDKNSEFSDGGTEEDDIFLTTTDGVLPFLGHNREEPELSVNKPVGAKRPAPASVRPRTGSDAYQYPLSVSSDVFGPTTPVFSAALPSSGLSSQHQRQNDCPNQANVSFASQRRMTIAAEPRHLRQQAENDEAEKAPSLVRRRHADTITTRLSEEQCQAFQELIQGTVRRPLQVSKSSLSDVPKTSLASIGAALEYQRSSPSGRRYASDALPCDLCGGMAKRLTTIEPCGHQACSVCCQSGLNQVTATPPRPHTCAACHQPVSGITLHKDHRRQLSEIRGGLFRIDESPGQTRPETPHREKEKRRLSFQSTPSSTTRSSSSFESHLASTSPSITRDAETGLASPATLSSKARAGRAPVICSSSPIKMRKGSMDPLKTNISPSDAAARVVDLDHTLVVPTSSDLLLTEDAPFFARDYVDQNRGGRDQQWHRRRHSPRKQSKTEGGGRSKDRAGVETYQGTFVVRVDNIPWTVAHNHVVAWLSDEADEILPDPDLVAQAIHVPVDLQTGKTANCCFIECRGKEEAMRLVRHRNNTRLLGRPVCLILTTYSDLLDEIFPSRTASSSRDDCDCVFFTPAELQQLVHLLTNGGAQLKSPAKVVELTTSMVRLAPPDMDPKLRYLLWIRTKEIVCLAVRAANELKPLREAMDRLLLACSNSSSFTVAQRIDLLSTARDTLDLLRTMNEVALSIGDGAPGSGSAVSQHYLPETAQLAYATHRASFPEQMSPNALGQILQFHNDGQRGLEAGHEVFCYPHTTDLDPYVPSAPVSNYQRASLNWSTSPLSPLSSRSNVQSGEQQQVKRKASRNLSEADLVPYLVPGGAAHRELEKWGVPSNDKANKPSSYGRLARNVAQALAEKDLERHRHQEMSQ